MHKIQIETGWKREVSHYTLLPFFLLAQHKIQRVALRVFVLMLKADCL